MTPEDQKIVSDRTADLLALADVKRWGVIKTLRPQSVAEHSFSVAVLSMELAERLFDGKVDYDDGMYLLWWALIHDAPETLTGDVDGKFKRDNPDFRMALIEAENKAFPWYAIMARYTIPERIKWIVKVADKVETLAFIRVWGRGPRADDVYHELLKILFDEVVPELARQIETDTESVEYHVRDVLHHSTSEDNSIQLRRHRRP